jgi:hypothetical protein
LGEGRRLRLNPRIYLLSKFPNARQKRGGTEITIPCPFHHENNPSMSIVLDTGVYHCFGCRKKGNFPKLYMRLEGVSWKEALEICGVFYDDSYSGPRKKVDIKFPEGLISCSKSMSPYLKYRKFTGDDLKLFDVYWRGSDYMVFFPIKDEKNKLISYVSRKAKGKDYYFPEYSPHMDYLYGENLKLQDRVIIVEGIIDVISVYRGGGCALATFNINFTIAQQNRLKRFVDEGRCREYIVIYDKDASKRAEDLEFQLSSMGIMVSQFTLEYGDPGDKSRVEMENILSKIK